LALGTVNNRDSHDDDQAIADAWNIHSAITGWTSSVDSKASFVSAIETAVLLGVVTLAGDNRQLSDLHGRWQLGFFWAGTILMVLSLGCVLSVVTPHLRGKAARKHHHDSFIYFGHARHWKPAELETALRDRDILPILARQIIVTSDIAWRKHRRLQLSIAGAGLAAAFVGLAALINFNT
jgi:hypothetical protein